MFAAVIKTIGQILTEDILFWSFIFHMKQPLRCHLNQKRFGKTLPALYHFITMKVEGHEVKSFNFCPNVFRVFAYHSMHKFPKTAINNIGTKHFQPQQKRVSSSSMSFNGNVYTELARRLLGNSFQPGFLRLLASAITQPISNKGNVFSFYLTID